MIRASLQLLSLATALALLFTGAAKSEETTIAIDNFTFAPAAATVKAGTKVRFVNHDDVPLSICQ